MVKTRSKSSQEDNLCPQTDQDLSVELLASLAFSKIEEKLKDRKEMLPDVLLLPQERELKSGLCSQIDTGPTNVTINNEDTKHKELMKKCVITNDFEKREAAPPIHVSRHKLKKMKKAERDKSTGSGWFNMPAPEMTQELKNDLQVLQMRSTLDRTHYYKSSDWKKLPKYFQVGRVIEGAGEFYSARIPKKQRKRTIVEELLADQEFRKYQKRKYVELQKSKQVLRNRKKKKFTKSK